MKLLKSIVILLYFTSLSQLLIGQKDSIKSDMKFDFGITRDKNINIWPLLRYYREGKQLDLQVLSPVFRKQVDTLTQTTRSHLFPIYWNYSDINVSDKRFLSLYYPSLIRTKNDSATGTNSFRFLELAPEINMLEFTKSKDGLFVQNNLLFFIWSKNDRINHRSHFITFPLYWNFKSPENKTSLFFPLYLNHKKYNYNDTSSLSTFFPLYWSFKNKRTNNKVITPLIWRMKNDDYQSFTFAPLFSTGKSLQSERKHLMVGSLYWQFNTSVGKDRVFPLYWNRLRYYENDTSKFTTLFPLYWSFKNKQKNNKVIAPPLVWSFKKDTYKSFTFFPFYSRGISSDSSRKYRMLATAYWKIENERSKNNLLFPVFFNRKRYHENDTSKFTTLFPVYWSYRNETKNNKVVFPVLWSVKNNSYKTFSVLPLYFRRMATDSTSKRLMLGSVYWQYRSPRRKSWALFPVYFNNKRYFADDTTRFKMVFPLYFSYSDKNVKRSVLFPISWNMNNGSYKSFTLIPLYSKGESLVSENRHFMLGSIYWQFDKEDGKDRMIFPIYYKNWRYYDNDTSSFTTIFPLYWSYRDRDQNSKVVFPFSWSLKNKRFKSYTFVPFYSKGKQSDSDEGHLMVGSVFWQFKDEKSKNTLFLPLYFQQQRYKSYDTTKFTTVFPLYWSYKNLLGSQKILFPIIWRSKSRYYKSFTFVPLLSAGRSVAGSENHLVLTPLFWHFKNKDAKSNTLFPLYWSYKDNEENNKVFFPLIWSFKDKEHKSFTFLPIYSSGKWFDDKRYTAVTPLYWQIKNEEEKFNLLFPLYDSYSNVYGDKKTNVLFFVWRNKKVKGRRTTQFLWPFGESIKDNNYRYFRFAPIIWYKKTPEKTHFSFQPFYYADETKEYKSHHVLWQLYTSTNYFGEKKSRRFLWKVFFKDKYENNDFETRFLYLVYANVNRRGVVEKSLFPIYHKREDSKGNKSFSLFFYFYNSFQRRLENSNDFYRENKIFWFIRLRSNYGKLKREGKI